MDYSARVLVAVRPFTYGDESFEVGDVVPDGHPAVAACSRNLKRERIVVDGGTQPEVRVEAEHVEAEHVEDWADEPADEPGEVTPE